MDVIGRDQLVTLLVVPPDAADDAARGAMRAASSADNRDRAGDLLAAP